MSDLIAHAHVRRGAWSGAWGRCILTYDERMLRRRVLRTTENETFLVDLPKVTSVEQGDAFQLADGRFVEVRAATEQLYELRGPSLARLAWHIGNRHTPCQIEADRLLIQRDHVLQKMLVGLGAEILEVEATFSPEGGAYGHGRTLAHHHDH